jgi:hypothetical protein
VNRCFFVEHAIRLGVRAVRESGALAQGPGGTTTVVCADVNGRRLDIGVQRIEREGVSTIHLGYAVGEVPVNEQVALAWVPCRLGGVRALFICGGCGTRRAALFLPPNREGFRCRDCHRLRFEASARHRDLRFEALVRPNRVLQRVGRKLACVRSSSSTSAPVFSTSSVLSSTGAAVSVSNSFSVSDSTAATACFAVTFIACSFSDPAFVVFALCEPFGPPFVFLCFVLLMSVPLVAHGAVEARAPMSAS